MYFHLKFGFSGQQVNPPSIQHPQMLNFGLIIRALFSFCSNIENNPGDIVFFKKCQKICFFTAVITDKIHWSIDPMWTFHVVYSSHIALNISKYRELLVHIGEFFIFVKYKMHSVSWCVVFICTFLISRIAQWSFSTVLKNVFSPCFQTTFPCVGFSSVSKCKF